VIRRAGGINANYVNVELAVRVVTMRAASENRRHASSAFEPQRRLLSTPPHILRSQGLFHRSRDRQIFVTLGASLALGTSGAVAKLLALPTFCAVVIAARLFNTALSNRRWPAFEILIALPPSTPDHRCCARDFNSARSMISTAGKPF